jgi:hypothetical protein
MALIIGVAYKGRALPLGWPVVKSKKAISPKPYTCNYSKLYNPCYHPKAKWFS